MYAFRTRHGPADLCFTDRSGGVGASPGAELGRHVVEDFTQGDPVRGVHQVHGGGVAVVGDAVAGPVTPPDADALVTDLTGVTLVVRAADCVPVLLVDEARGVVAAAHCGRAGLLAGILRNTVAAMRELGAVTPTAWIGPHVCGACYEVPLELQDEVASAVPTSRATTSWGTPSLDLGAGVRAQLEDEHVTVVDVSRCTLESADLHSYRRDGLQAGRNAALVRLRRPT